MKDNVEKAAIVLIKWVGKEDVTSQAIKLYEDIIHSIADKLGAIDEFDKVQHMQQQLDASETKVIELQNQLKRFQQYNQTTATAIADWYERGKRRMDAICDRLGNPAP